MNENNDFKPGMNADTVARELALEEAGKRLAERKRRGRPPMKPEKESDPKTGPRISGTITGTINDIAAVFDAIGIKDRVITIELEEEECTRT